jgi:hypothetical protein
MDKAKSYYKIISDGTVSGTKIIDNDSGKELFVSEAYWYVDAKDGVAYARVVLPFVEIEAIGEKVYD